MNIIKVFTDGSSRGNPGPGGWAVVIYSGDHVKELGGYGGDSTTNNKMEIRSAIEALRFIDSDSSISSAEISVEINSDSSYLINGITKWIFGWMKNGWISKTGEDVANKDLWQELYSYTSKIKVSWNKVAGHAGVHANERCDVIANTLASGEEIELFDGNVSDYSETPVAVSDDSNVNKSNSRKRNKSGVGYYLSYVDSILMKHNTWTECESRVKGVKGAKFKKVKDSIEEQETLKSWGL